MKEHPLMLFPSSLELEVADKKLELNLVEAGYHKYMTLIFDGEELTAYFHSDWVKGVFENKGLIVRGEIMYSTLGQCIRIAIEIL